MDGHWAMDKDEEVGTRRRGAGEALWVAGQEANEQILIFLKLKG
jgi:hypothetical protein